jgi:hypothetical protein
VIQFKAKTKVSKKPKKKATSRVSSRVPRRPVGYFALTPEEVSEINMFCVASAKSVVAADKREKAAPMAQAKSASKRRP